MKRDAFLMYSSFYEPVSDLTDEQLGRLFRAIFRYNAGEDVQVAPDICMAFKFFKKQFEADKKEYDAMVEMKSRAGRLGGGNPNFVKGQPNPYYKKDKQTLSEINRDKQTLSEINRDMSTHSISNTYSAKNQGGEKETENEKEKVIQKEKDKEKETTKKENILKEKSHIIPNDNPPISDDYRRFIDWMRENAPYCNSHMTLPTEKEFYSLKQMWAAADIADQILNIENRLDLRKKYKSLYRTLLNWLKHATVQKIHTA